jgi:hypothetical protein
MQEYIEQWTSLNNAAIASLKELGEINSKAIEKFTEQQLGIMGTFFDLGVKQVNLLNETKGYKEMLSGQAKLVAEYNDKVLETIRKSTGIVAESKDELTAWVEKGVESTISPIKKAAAAPLKKAAA